MKLRSAGLYAAVLPTLMLLSTGCPPPPVAPISLVADPPPVEGGRRPGEVQTALDRGMAYVKAEAWADALPHFDTVLQADDTNAAAHYYRGIALKHLNRLEEAETELTRAIELDATLMEPRVHLAELLLTTEPPRPDKAIAILKPAVTAEPKAKDTRELLAYAHYLLEHWSESADHYAVLVELEDKKETRFQLADTLFRAGRLDESVVHMRKLLPIFSKELKIVVQLSHRFGKAKAFEDCVAGFDTAIKLAPDKPAFYLHRGVCKHGLNNEKAARMDYLKAIEKDLRFQPAYFYLGKSWLHEQRRQKAVEAFNKCIKLNPDSKIAGKARAALDRMKKEAR